MSRFAMYGSVEGVSIRIKRSNIACRFGWVLWLGVFGTSSVQLEPIAEQTVIEEVIVTSQRREQRLQDVPLSVVAYNQEAIEDRVLVSFADVALATPGFVLSTTFGAVTPTIRGIGADRYSASSEPGVALYVDDIYMGRSYLPQVALAQIERIEVLKGPQGTLYGRNTSGGALKIVTLRPSHEFELSASQLMGSYDEHITKASVSVPFTQWLALRFSGYRERSDGYTYNRTRNEYMDGREVDSFLFSGLVTPWEWLDIDIKVDRSEQFDTGPSIHSNVPLTFSVLDDRQLAPPFEPYSSLLNPYLANLDPADPILDTLTDREGTGRRSTEPRETLTNAPTYTDVASEGFSTRITTQFRGIEGKLIAGRRDSERNSPIDTDLTDGEFIRFSTVRTTGDQVSAELQFSSDIKMPWGGNLHWLFGGFYYREHATEIIDTQVASLQTILGTDSSELDTLLAAAGGQIPPELIPVFQGAGLTQVYFDSALTTRSKAIFADFEWNLREWLILRLGGRLTRDTKILENRTIHNPDSSNACEGDTGKDTFENATYKLGVDFPFYSDRMLYASFSQGYKSGGYNGLTCSSPVYFPEFVDTIEIGLKSQWLDGLLQVNAAVFDYDYTDIQIEKVIVFASTVSNATEAVLSGAELDVIYIPRPFLKVDLGLAYLESEYLEYFEDDPYTVFDESKVDLSGNRLNKTPRWSWTLGARLSHVFESGNEIGMRVEASYTDEMYYDQFNHDYAFADDYTVWNVYLDWKSPRSGFIVRGFVKNAEDDTYVAGMITPSAIVGGPFVYYGKPRTYGVEVSWRSP